MITEFQQLAKKIEQMVTLVQTLRNENTDLHRQMLELTASNAALTERIQEAHDRISEVLSHAPFDTHFTDPVLTGQEQE